MEILLKVLYKSLCEGLVEILVTCCQRPLHDLVQVRVRSSWRCPDEIRSVSLHDLVQVLVRRSCGDSVEILLKRSLHYLALRSWISSALLLVWKFLRDAHGKFLYEDLVGSFKSIYIEGPAAAVAVMSNLICYCSIATVACIWHIDFLPPHTVWGLFLLLYFEGMTFRVLNAAHVTFLDWRPLGSRLSKLGGFERQGIGLGS